MKTVAPLWILLCFYIWAAEGQINATAGDNVTPPFQAPKNLSITVVRCSRADLEPEYLFLYRNGLLYPDDQHPSFVNRVELQEKQKKDEYVSFILNNAMTADSGTCECLVDTEKNGTKKELISIITLSVVAPPGSGGGFREDGGKEDGRKEDGGEEDGSVGLIVGLSVPAVLLLAGVVGFWIYRKHQKQQIQCLNSPRTQTQTQISLSSFQLNSEPPAADVPLLSVVID